MFAFIKKCFFTAMTVFNWNELNAIPLKRVSMSNPECKIRLAIMNINSDEPSFYPYSIQINECSGIYIYHIIIYIIIYHIIIYTIIYTIIYFTIIINCSLLWCLCVSLCI